MSEMLGTTDEPQPQTDETDDTIRHEPTDPPEVVPAISGEQPGIAAGLGLSGFAKDPDHGFEVDEGNDEMDEGAE
jgi:hypothetical protein